MIVAAVAVLVGVFFAATGRGGEMSYEPADHAPLDLGPVSAADVALLHPPTALWGYNVQVTDEALDRIARAMRDRDVTIAYLQQRIADLAGQPAPAPEASRPQAPQHARPEDRHDPAGPADREPPAGHAPGDYRGRDDLAGPADREPPAGHAPEDYRGRDDPAGPADREPPAGHAPGDYRGRDDLAGPAAAPAAGEQDR